MSLTLFPQQSKTNDAKQLVGIHPHFKPLCITITATTNLSVEVCCTALAAPTKLLVAYAIASFQLSTKSRICSRTFVLLYVKKCVDQRMSEAPVSL